MTRTMSAAGGASVARRVVVTGLGAVTPLGGTFRETWTRLLQHRSGLTDLPEALQQQHLVAPPSDGGDTIGTNRVDEAALEQDLQIARQLSCQVAAPVRDVVSTDARTPRFVQLALMASREALLHAQLEDLLGDDSENDSTDTEADDPRILLRQRTGVSIGSGMSSVRQVQRASRLLDEHPGNGVRRLSPHFVPSVLQNSAAARVSIRHRLQGPNVSASTACAAGSHAVGDAYLYLQAGLADVMLAGATEAALEPLGLAGFGRLRALSTKFNETPAAASRPFDARRDGFVMGEGAAVLVLEELEHARARGAPILSELVGYGASGDGHHITAPDPRGRGALRAMRMALGSVSDPVRVGYVNAHATSTPVGDDIEARVIHELIHLPPHQDVDATLVSSTKGATGHLLGAAGAVEAAFVVQSLMDQVVPATLNLEDAPMEQALRLQHVRQAQSHDFEFAMSNSFGFGGTNASLLFKKWTE